MRLDGFGLSQAHWQLLTKLLLKPVKEAGGESGFSVRVPDVIIGSFLTWMC